MVPSIRGRSSQSGLKTDSNQGRTVNLDKMITFSCLCFLIWRLGDKYSADFMKLL